MVSAKWSWELSEMKPLSFKIWRLSGTLAILGGVRGQVTDEGALREVLRIKRWRPKYMSTFTHGFTSWLLHYVHQYNTQEQTHTQNTHTQLISLTRNPYSLPWIIIKVKNRLNSMSVIWNKTKYKMSSFFYSRVWLLASSRSFPLLLSPSLPLSSSLSFLSV